VKYAAMGFGRSSVMVVSLREKRRSKCSVFLMDTGGGRP
jgi:hypothetical protein